MPLTRPLPVRTFHAMIVSKNMVVTIDYTLTGEDGAVLDSSKGQEPLAYIHGSGNVIDGLEAALEGKKASDHVSVTVAPADGYGTRDESFVFPIPRAQFAGVDDLAVGMQFALRGEDMERVATVVGLSDSEVTVDANHPLAGMTLHFEVDVVGVREATAEELSHGHAHDGHGHHHHDS